MTGLTVQAAGRASQAYMMQITSALPSPAPTTMAAIAPVAERDDRVYPHQAMPMAAAWQAQGGSAIEGMCSTYAQHAQQQALEPTLSSPRC